MPDLVGVHSSPTTFGFASLHRRWRLIGTCGALSLLLGALIIELMPATYTSSTQLLVYVRELQPGPQAFVSPGRADPTQVQNEIEIIRSRGMLAKVASTLNLGDDDEFAPRQTLPRALAEWAFQAPKATSEDSRARLDLAAEALEKRVKVQKVGTSHTILVSVTTFEPHKSERIASEIGRTAVEARVSAEQEGGRSPSLRERLQGLGPSAYLMTAAGAAGRPDGPQKALLIPATAIFGVALGSALALLLDFRNRTIRTAAHVEYLGMECLGFVPRFRRRQGVAEPMAEEASAQDGAPHPMLDQTLRRVVVAVESSKARIVGISSVVPGEGATTVAQRLAQLAAAGGKKVLLVDASRAYPAAGIQRKGNFRATDICEQQAGEQIVRKSVAGLDLMKATSLDVNNIHGAPTWGTLHDQNCFAAHDLILVDLPPLERVAEFQAMAQNLDGVLLVLKWGNTELEKAMRSVAASGVGPSEFIGAVLNMVDERMVGKFGDKLWKAEAMLVALRRPHEPRDLVIG